MEPLSSLAGMLFSVEVWKFLLPVLGGAITWIANEWRKRRAALHERKEERYKELLQALHGFYGESHDPTQVRAEFVSQLNVAWLYCPDHVIRKGYDFLDAAREDSKATASEKRQALGEFVLAARQDLLSRRLLHRTQLGPEDFRHPGIGKVFVRQDTSI